jgi:DNA-binding SARP family transcriptional activator
VHFRILGSLELTASGKRIPIGAPKQRAILAALLLDAGKDVSINRLTRFIWDDQPPATAQTTLQSYIYRLRRLLRPLPVELKTTSSDCYRLNVGPDELDLWYFRRLVGAAREHACRGQLSESTAELRKSLAIWRGNALSGIPGETIRQEAALLEGERIAAYEELFTTEIKLGSHRQIIPELQKVVASHPFHESLSALLMLSLYASGRQVDALQHYGRIRRRLRDDLGIAPGQELQELHQRILEQHPAEELTCSRGSWLGRWSVDPVGNVGNVGKDSPPKVGRS